MPSILFQGNLAWWIIVKLIQIVAIAYCHLAFSWRLKDFGNFQQAKGESVQMVVSLFSLLVELLLHNPEVFYSFRNFSG